MQVAAERVRNARPRSTVHWPVRVFAISRVALLPAQLRDCFDSELLLVYEYVIVQVNSACGLSCNNHMRIYGPSPERQTTRVKDCKVVQHAADTSIVIHPVLFVLQRLVSCICA